MLDFKLHTPIGVGDLLPDETEIKKYVIKTCTPHTPKFMLIVRI